MSCSAERADSGAADGFDVAPASGAPAAAEADSEARVIGDIVKAIEGADALLIGAGAGLSTSAGLTYDDERFERLFGDFRERFGITDMYSGGFYPFPDLETYWAWWSRSIYWNRYEVTPGSPYLDLLDIVRGRDHFILTTNVDHQFQLAGFDRRRLFYTQGDYGLFQCSRPCRQETYDNERTIRAMVEGQRDLRVPTELLPVCPHCGAPLVPNLRVDGTFVEDEGWKAASGRYRDFLRGHADSRLVFMELGVGGNTPGIIKYPFWEMTAGNPLATYICVNLDDVRVPSQIADRSLCVRDDIGRVLREVKGRLSYR